MSETSSERLARLLTLVPWLRANDGITITQAAEDFGVTPDQLTSDLWQLIVCGIPGYGPDQLVDIQFWDDDVIHVIDAIALDRPLRLTGEEVAALHVALRVLAQVPGDHDRQALVSAMAKLEEAGAPSVSINVSVSIDSGVRAAIDSAVAQQRWLLIRYAAADGDLITERRIQPMNSYAVNDRVYVQAWCEVATDIRTFRLDRIHSAEVIDPPAGMEVSPVTAAIAIAPEHTQVARIAIDPQAAWIMDTEDVEPLPQTHEALIRYASLDWLARWVLGHGGRVRVLEPEPARLAVHKAAGQRLGSV